jgi:hypothetical protein
VEYRGCRDESQVYCGPPSAPISLTPVNTRVTSASCVKDGVLPLGVSAPAGLPKALPIGFEVQYHREIVPGSPVWDAEFGPLTNEPVPSDAIGVRVRATVSVGSTFIDPLYGEFPCT